MQPKQSEFRHMYYYSPNSQRRQIIYTPTKYHLKYRLFLIMFIVLTGSAVAWFPTPQGSTNKSVAAVATSKVAADPKPKVPTISTEEMGAKINAIIAANLDTDVGVAITDLTSGQTYHYGLTEVFEAASIGKLITAANYLQEVEDKKRSLDDKVAGVNASEQIKLMLEKSDNVSWRAMNSELTHDSLEAYAKFIGLQTYDPDKNYIAVDDINIIVTKLYTGKLLNKTHTQQLLTHMKIANEADYIPPAVPAGINVYHKAGLLEDRVHDAAIIDDGNRAYSLVIFTNGQKRYHKLDRATLFHQITKVTIAHFINSTL